MKARTEGTILLTVDLDFAQLLATSGDNLPSVILFRLGNENYNTINERLTEVLRECETDLEVKERAMPSLREASPTAGFAYTC